MTWTKCSFLLSFYVVSRHCLNSSINLLFRKCSFFSDHGSVGCSFGAIVVPRFCTKLSYRKVQIFRSTLSFLWSVIENHCCFSSLIGSSHPLKMWLHFLLDHENVAVIVDDWRMNWTLRHVPAIHAQCLHWSVFSTVSNVHADLQSLWNEFSHSFCFTVRQMFYCY